MYSSEIKKSNVLQWALSFLVFAYFLVFYSWIRQSNITLEVIDRLRYVCPPYFKSCGDWYFLEALPQGYSQTFFYMVIFGLFLWIIYLIANKKWKEAQINLIPIFLWHAANTLFLTHFQGGNYEYYLIVFGIVLLFLPHKEFFLKLSLVSFYVISTVAKIHPAWIEGGYFTAMRTGLPFFPDWSIPVFTNLVILAEMLGSWLLLAKKGFWQRSAVVFFTIFHLYSGILVEYRYPATVLPMILIVFGPWYKQSKVPLDKKSISGWVLILILFTIQIGSVLLIPGDEKLTLEGNRYGLYMFESNHQCISEAKIHYKDGSQKDSYRIGNSARDRCNPYVFWFRFNNQCDTFEKIERISWTFDHSINGGPFYRIVDTENICDLDYRAFGRNEWIKEASDSEEIGYPVRNVYY